VSLSRGIVRFLRRLFVAVLIVVACLAALLVFLLTTFPRRIAPRILASAGIGVSYASGDFDPVARRLQISELRVTYLGHELLRCPRFHADLGLSVHGIVIRASIAKPIIWVARSPNGEFLLPIGSKGAPSRWSRLISLESLLIDDATIHYRDAASNLELDIRHAQITMAAGSPYELGLRAPFCQVRHGERAVDSAIQMRAVLESPIRMELLDATGQGFRVTVRDQRIDPRAPVFDAGGEIDVAPFLDALKIAQPDTGRVEGRLRFDAGINLPERRITFRTDAPHLHLSSVELTPFESHGRYSFDGSLDAQATAGVARGRSTVRVRMSSGRGNADLTLDAIDPRQLPMLTAKLPLKPAAAVSGTARFEWAGRAPRLSSVRGRAHLSLQPLRPEKGDLTGSGDIDVELAGGSLQLAPTRLRIGASTTLDIEGTAAPGAVDLRFTSSVSDVRQLLIETLGTRVRLPESLQGSMTLAGHVGGNGTQISCRFHTPSLALADARFTEMNGTIEVDGSTIRISDVRSELYGGSFSGEAALQGSSYRIHAAGESLRLREVSPIFIGGTGGFSVEGDGQLGAPRLTGELRVEDVETRETNPESFAGQFELTSESLVADLYCLDRELAGTVALGLREPYPLYLSADFVDLPVASLLTRYRNRSDLKTAATGRAVLATEVQNPRCASGELILTGASLDIGGVRIQNSADISIGLQPERFEIRKLGLEGDGRRFDLSGTIPLEPERPLDLHLSGAFTLDVLEVLAPGLQAGGTVEADASFSGVAPDIAGTGTLRLRGVEFSHKDLPLSIRALEGDVRLEGTDLTLQGCEGRFERGIFTVDGKLPLSALPLLKAGTPRDMDLRVGIRSFGSENLASMMPGAVRRQVQFTLSSDLILGGNLHSLRDLTAEGTVTSLELNLAQTRFTNDTNPFRVTKSGGRVAVHDLQVSGDGITATAEAELDLESLALRGTASAQGANAFLKKYVPDSEFGGSNSLEVSIGGTLRKPELAGTLSVTNGRMSLPSRGIVLTSVEGRAVMAEGRVSVQGTALFNGGPAEVDGVASLDGFRLRDVEIDAAFDGCGTPFPPGLEGKIFGRVRLGQDKDSFLLDGDLWLREASYKKNIGIEREILASVPTKKEVKAEPSIFSSLNLDVRLSAEDQVAMRNNIADLRFRGDLTVRGTVGKPRIYGHVETQPDGLFRFQGREYKVQMGTLGFEGDETFNPRLEVQATVPVRVSTQRSATRNYASDKHTIRVSLTGKLADPVLGLQDADGQPPLSEIECASVLLTGQIIGEGSVFSKDNLKNQMARFIGGNVGNTFLPVIGRRLGIDQFEIQSNYISTETEAPTSRALIGKDFGGGLFFTYSPDLSNTQRYMYILDYQAGRNVAFRATRNDDASISGRVTHNIGFNLFSGRHLQPPISLTGALPLTTEPDKQYIAEIVVDGLKATSSAVVLRQLTFRTGEELDYDKIYESQRQLYSLNVFRSVRIVPEKVAGREDLVNVRVMLNEQNVYQFFYGLRYSTEGKVAGRTNQQNPEGLDGELEIHNVNFTGKAVDLGFYTRQSRPERTYKLTLSIPPFFGRRLDTSAVAYTTHLVDEDPFGTFESDELGGGVQFKQSITKKTSILYYATTKRVKVHQLDGGMGAIDLPATVRTRLGTSYIGDFRDDSLNAKKGFFTATTLEFQPKKLSTLESYVKIFGQFAFYKTIGPLTIALNNRAGVMRTKSPLLLQADAFYTGGGSSVRSFAEDMVGPRQPFTPDLPRGGRAVVVYNQELRASLFKITRRVTLGGVIFHDAGNVFWEVADFRPFDVRRSAGFGLRIDSPYSLFRIDWAFTIRPQPLDNRNRLTFGLGQMF